MIIMDMRSHFCPFWILLLRIDFMILQQLDSTESNSKIFSSSPNDSSWLFAFYRRRRNHEKCYALKSKSKFFLCQSMREANYAPGHHFPTRHMAAARRSQKGDSVHPVLLLRPPSLPHSLSYVPDHVGTQRHRHRQRHTDTDVHTRERNVCASLDSRTPRSCLCSRSFSLSFSLSRSSKG